MRKHLFAPLAFITLVMSIGCAMRVEPLSNLPGGAQDSPVVDRAQDGPLDQQNDDPADPADDPEDPTLIGPGGDDEEPNGTLSQWDSSRPFTSIRGGRMKGTIGAAQNFDLPSDIAFVYDDGYFTQVEVYALRSDGQRVMIQLQSDNAVGEPFFVPGIGMRFRPGYVDGRFVGALACQGPDSGVEAMGMAFADTPFDEEPCDVGVDTEEDPEGGNALNVTVQATFPDENGDCPDVPDDDDGDGDADLPDPDGDGDGDLPVDGEPGDGSTPGGGDGSGAYPLSASATFKMVQ
jgi:hypothetical protein